MTSDATGLRQIGRTVARWATAPGEGHRIDREMAHIEMIRLNAAVPGRRELALAMRVAGAYLDVAATEVTRTTTVIGKAQYRHAGRTLT